MQQKTYPEDTNTAPDLFRPPSAATASTLSKVVPDPMAETTTGSTAGESKQSSAGAAPDVVLRHINLNTSEDNPTMSNVVKTATYTWYSFIPLFLFFQFRRPANIYFLTICVLQVFPMWSITKNVPTMALPLMFILGVAAIKEILEDMDKHKADNIQNGRVVDVLDPTTKTWESKKWSTLRCGQLVRVKNREFVPADLVLLVSSDQTNNGVFINTKSLDGETDLKIREVPDSLIQAYEDDGIHSSGITGQITCEPPSKILTKFEGAYEPKRGGAKTPITLSNVLLRGCQIKQTEFAIGAVVYTGQETRIQMNFGKVKKKVSTLARWADGQLKFVALFDLVCCLIAAISSVTIRSGVIDTFWYEVPGEVGSKLYLASQEFQPFSGTKVGLFVEFIYLFFTYILIFAVFIPISLLVTIDMAKFLQMFTIQWDRNMYYEKNDIACQVRAPDLNESLGMVNHVFSDKTGTLTCNIMEFRKCSIMGKSYGKGSTQIGRGRMRREKIPIPPEPVNKGRVTPFVNFIDTSLDKLMANNDEASHDFMLNMALNHEVTPEQIDGQLDYGGPSPDEIAFVWFAKHMGYTLVAKPSRQSLAITRPNGKEETWEVLDILQFTSTRKRSSVIVRQIGPDGKLWKNMSEEEKKKSGKLRCFAKGADNVMMKMLRKDIKETDQLYLDTVHHTTEFSKDGLRILVIGQKYIDYDYYDAWSERYATSKVAEVDRDALMETVMAEIEKDMDLVGVTAIEDKLQNGVPEAISAMRAGGIKVWVLTGDKVDTAINIGYACEVMTDEMILIELNIKNAAVKATLQLNKNGNPTVECLERKLGEAKANIAKSLKENKECVLVIDTYFLSSIVEFKCGDKFLSLARACKSVVAARVSPDQKGEIVRMVRAEALQKETRNDALVTLAIGDGANDVTMIKEAHIGIGIDGLEGKQAVNSSDYAIGQFKYLHRLMFVHGRWNYRRMSILILYMFYKNCLLVLPQWMLGTYCMFSGQNFYVEYPLYQLSNIAFTAFPIIFFAVLDQDVVAEIPLQVPELYKDGNIFGIHFSMKTFWIWMAEGTWSALVCFTFCMWSLGQSPSSGNPATPNSLGKGSDVWYIGTVVHLSVTTIQNLRLALEVRHYNYLTTASFILSMMAWFVLILFFSYVPALAYGLSSSEAIGLDAQVFYDATAWLTAIVSIFVSLLPAILMKVCNQLYYPKLNVIASELQKKHYSKIRPDKEYYFACLCCGKNANANVPIDGQEPIMKPSAADNAAGNAAGKGVELTSIAGQKNDDYENPMNAAVAASEDIQVFKDLRQRLVSKISGND